MADIRSYQLPRDTAPALDDVLWVDKAGGPTRHITLAQLSATLAQRERIYNVLDYGASTVASAATNTAAFQAAIAALPDFGVLNIPAGNYNLDDVLLFDTKRYIFIVGHGAMLTFASGTSGDLVTLDGCNNVTISDLSIFSNSHDNGGNGLYINGCWGVHLERIQIAGAQHNQVSVYQSWTISTAGCSFTATDADAGYAAWYEKDQANQITHDITYFKGAAGVPACWHVSGDALVYKNCTFESDHSATGDGLVIEEAKGVSIIGCYSESCGRITYKIGDTNSGLASGVHITGCYIVLGNANNATGISLISVLGCTIDNCYIIDSHALSGTKGIVLQSGALYPQRVVIGRGTYFESLDTDVSDAGQRAINNMLNNTFYATPKSGDAEKPNLLTGTYVRTGDMCVNTNAVAGEPSGWVCSAGNGYATKESWTGGHTYIAGEWITTGSCIYVCKTAGGGTVANMPTHTTGDATGADGYTWSYIAPGDALQWHPTTQLYTRLGSGNPNGSVTSYLLGELYLDTSGGMTWWISMAAASTTWKALT